MSDKPTEMVRGDDVEGDHVYSPHGRTSEPWYVSGNSLALLFSLYRHEDILMNRVATSADEAFKEHPQRDEILELDIALDALDGQAS